MAQAIFSKLKQQIGNVPSSMYIYLPQDGEPIIFSYKAAIQGKSPVLDYPAKSGNFFYSHSQQFKISYIKFLRERADGNFDVIAADANNPQHVNTVISVLKPYAARFNPKAIENLKKAGWTNDMIAQLQNQQEAAAQQAEQTQNSEAFQNMATNNQQDPPVNAEETIPPPEMTEQDAHEAADAANQTEENAKQELKGVFEKLGAYPKDAQKIIKAISNASNTQDFKYNDAVLYNLLAKQINKARRNGFTNKEDLTVLDQMQDLLNKRMANQIWNATNFDDIPTDIRNELFDMMPKFQKGKIPKISEFGRMHRNEGLSYMVNQSQAFDAMMEILHSSKKVTFNPNLLNYEGASRYARSIGGKLAPVADYDGDGMPDFYIYNKSGKIVVINGMRLKDNHKMQLKRIFYQAFPDKSKRKLMGGSRCATSECS